HGVVHEELLDPLVQRALAKEPANRFQTAVEMRRELERVRELLQSRVQPPRVRKSSGRAGALFAVAVALSIAGGIATWAAWPAAEVPRHRGPPREPSSPPHDTPAQIPVDPAPPILPDA